MRWIRSLRGKTIFENESITKIRTMPLALSLGSKFGLSLLDLRFHPDKDHFFDHGHIRTFGIQYRSVQFKDLRFGSRQQSFGYGFSTLLASFKIYWFYTSYFHRIQASINFSAIWNFSHFQIRFLFVRHFYANFDETLESTERAEANDMTTWRWKANIDPI